MKKKKIASAEGAADRHNEERRLGNREVGESRGNYPLRSKFLSRVTNQQVLPNLSRNVPISRANIPALRVSGCNGVCWKARSEPWVLVPGSSECPGHLFRGTPGPCPDAGSGAGCRAEPLKSGSAFPSVFTTYFSTLQKKHVC